MPDRELFHRLHFAFTITYHYLFPQLTMGLALLIVVLKTLAIRRNDEHFNDAARFWARIFGINFVMGVVTGIPMEFQFGTNWAQFSRLTGGVIGQPLAMEGSSTGTRTPSSPARPVRVSALRSELTWRRSTWRDRTRRSAAWRASR